MILGQLPPTKIAPPTPKLTLTQPLTLTGGQCSSETIVWLPPSRKTNPNRDPNPNPNRRAILLGGNFPDTVRHKTDALENFKKMNKKTSATASTLF